MTSQNSKTIIITGAAQGLGREVATQAAGLSMSLILVDIAKEKLDDTVKTLQDDGAQAEGFVCDVSDIESVRKICQEIKEKHKSIDILLNNAGIWTDTDLEAKNVSRRLDTLKSNTLGMINMTEELLPYFLDKNRGTIANLISVAATYKFDDLKDWRVYGASKWGAHGYTKSLRDILADKQVKVVAIYPGGFESNLYENAGRENAHNQPWMMKTEDVANAVIYAINQPEDVEISEIVITKKM